MSNVGKEGIVSIGLENSLIRKFRQTAKLAGKSATLTRFAAPTATSLLFIALAVGSSYNMFGVTNNIPDGGYRSSIIAAATPTPTAVVKEAQPQPTPEQMIPGSGDYIKLGFESLQKKGQDGKSITDYLTEKGYKIITDKGFIPLADAEFGEVDTKKMAVLSIPLPEDDPNYKDYVVAELDSKQRFPIYAIFSIFDPEKRILSIMGLGNPQSGMQPSWINIGTVDSEGVSFKGIYRQKFTDAITGLFFPAQTNPAIKRESV